MDAPLASIVAERFLEGYVKQAKKGEKEAEEIVKAIDYNALLALCTRYDNKTGEYPGHEHEGAAVLAFFERLQHNVANPKAKVRER